MTKQAKQSNALAEQQPGRQTAAVHRGMHTRHPQLGAYAETDAHHWVI